MSIVAGTAQFSLSPTKPFCQESGRGDSTQLRLDLVGSGMADSCCHTLLLRASRYHAATLKYWGSNASLGLICSK